MACLSPHGFASSATLLTPRPCLRVFSIPVLSRVNPPAASPERRGPQPCWKALGVFSSTRPRTENQPARGGDPSPPPRRGAPVGSRPAGARLPARLSLGGTCRSFPDLGLERASCEGRCSWLARPAPTRGPLSLPGPVTCGSYVSCIRGRLLGSLARLACVPIPSPPPHRN